MGTRVEWDFSMHPFYNVFIFESYEGNTCSKQTNKMQDHNPVLRKAVYRSRVGSESPDFHQVSRRFSCQVSTH